MDGSFCRLTNSAHLLTGGFVTNMRSRGGAAIQFGSYLVAQRIVKRQVVTASRASPRSRRRLSICVAIAPGCGCCSAPVKHILAPAEETPSVNPSCGRWLALARCHRGGSPRTFQRAASSPRGAQAAPHPGKRNDRAPPPPASPRRAAPRLASPRLAAAHAHTHPRARARSARAKQPSKRVPNREPKGPGSNREPVRPPPLAVLAKASKAVLDIT